jgi:hypothetical protein
MIVSLSIMLCTIAYICLQYVVYICVQLMRCCQRWPLLQSLCGARQWLLIAPAFTSMEQPSLSRLGSCFLPIEYLKAI